MIMPRGECCRFSADLFFFCLFSQYISPETKPPPARGISANEFKLCSELFSNRPNKRQIEELAVHGGPLENVFKRRGMEVSNKNRYKLIYDALKGLY